MDEATIAKYIQARAQAEKEKTRIAEMIRAIKETAAALDEWTTVYVEGGEFPDPIRNNPSYKILRRTWPSVEQLAATLARWHVAAERAQEIWGELSEEDRHHLQPPPTQDAP